jgi:hypothetical protein
LKCFGCQVLQILKLFLQILKVSGRQEGVTHPEDGASRLLRSDPYAA